MSTRKSVLLFAMSIVLVAVVLLFQGTTTVKAQSGQISYAHGNGCTAPGGNGSIVHCSVTLTWVPAFIDTNYFPVCGGSVPTNFPVVQVNTKTATTVTVWVINQLTTLSSGVSGVNCIAMHQ